MELERTCDEYFRSVNPIAQRIAEDLENIHNANKDRWDDLDHKARQKMLDDNLIDAELVLKYQDEDCENPDLEHLSSFSWFTKSQLDLFTLIDVKRLPIKSPVRKTDLLSPLKKGDVADSKDIGIVNRIKQKVMKSPPPDDHRDVKQYSKTLPKPRMPPPPPPPKRSSNGENCLLLTGSTSQDDIPKTGFDFLDNW